MTEGSIAMTDDKPEIQLTDLANKLLSVLKSEPDKWWKRSEIASSIERKRLIPYDIELLDYLVDVGLAEKRVNIIKGTLHYEYHAVTSDS